MARRHGYGVFAELDLFDAAYARQLLPAIRAGQLGMSWRGSIEGEVLRERSRDGLERRRVRRVALQEFGPVIFPAYALTTDASGAARLGAELRSRRQERGLTLASLGVLTGYSLTHISDVERAKTAVSRQFIAACDAALDADAALLELLPAVVREREVARQDRAAARRWAADGERYDEDVDPTNRRGLLGAAGATAIGGLGVAAAPPAAARDVDPALVGHWTALLALLGSHDAMHGPREVLDVVRCELRVIAEHRAAARGELRAELTRVEARWTVYASFLCEDTGDRRGRDTLLERALRLALEADCPDVVAWACARRAQWSDAPRAVRFGEAGLRTPRAGAHTRALCAVRAAYGHARMGSADAADRLLAMAHELAARESVPPPGAALADTVQLVRCWQARCWSALKPARGVALYEDVLRDWPRRHVKDDGLYRARKALACADAGELDRARAEGRKALAIARATGSSVIRADLQRLGQTLAAAH